MENFLCRASALDLISTKLTNGPIRKPQNRQVIRRAACGHGDCRSDDRRTTEARRERFEGYQRRADRRHRLSEVQIDDHDGYSHPTAIWGNKKISTVCLTNLPPPVYHQRAEWKVTENRSNAPEMTRWYPLSPKMREKCLSVPAIPIPEAFKADKFAYMQYLSHYQI